MSSASGSSCLGAPNMSCMVGLGLAWYGMQERMYEYLVCVGVPAYLHGLADAPTRDWMGLGRGGEGEDESCAVYGFVCVA